MKRTLVALALASLLGLAGCITTTESVFSGQADPQKSLERRVQLARQYIGEGDWENAKRNLAQAAEIDPGNAEVQEAFALVYQSTGEFELAEESFEAALSLQPDFSRARNNYGAFLFARERYPEAEQQLERVVADSLYEQRPRAFINLGLVRLQLFDPQGAEQAFLRALSMDRSSNIALIELAQIRYDMGDYSSAQRYYDSYRKTVRQQSARGLWLGIRIARAAGDQDAEASYALVLRNRFPDSAEYDAYLRTRDGGS